MRGDTQVNIDFTPVRTLNITVFIYALIPIFTILSELSLGTLSGQTVIRTFLTFTLLRFFYKRKNWARQILIVLNYLTAALCLIFIYLFIKDAQYSSVAGFLLISLVCALFINQFQFREDLVALFYKVKGQENLQNIG